jgi:hypothetical protein
MRVCNNLCERIGLSRADIFKIKMSGPNRKTSIYTLGYVYCSVCNVWYTPEQTKPQRHYVAPVVNVK